MIENIIIVALLACGALLVGWTIKEKILVYHLKGNKYRENKTYLIDCGIEVKMDRLTNEIVKEKGLDLEYKPYYFNYIPYMRINLKHLESGIVVKYEMGLGRFGNSYYPIKDDEFELLAMFDFFNEDIFWDNKEIESSLASLIQRVKEYEYINS